MIKEQGLSVQHVSQSMDIGPTAIRRWLTQAETWDTHQIFRLSQFPRRVHQHNARRFPDTTFPQPRNWPGTASFDHPVDNKSLDRTPARRDN
jgi:hypothetical protein